MPIINTTNCQDFCGWGRPDAKTNKERIVEARRMADDVASKFAKPFFIARQSESGAGKSARLDVAIKTITGKEIDNIPQQTGDCFPAGTMVTMADGSERPIEQVRGGDIVLTHTGVPAKVLKLHQREYTGQMNTIRAANVGRSITSTASHEFVKVSNKGKTQRWTNAAALTDQQFVLIPAMFRMRDTIEHISLNEVAGTDINQSWHAGIVTKGCIQDPNAERGAFRKMKHQLPETVAVDDRFGRLIGLYLAEGGADDCKIQFSFAADEKDTLVAETQQLLKDIFGLESTQVVRHENESCIVVQCHSKSLVLFLKALVPGNVYSKQVPDVIMRAPVHVRMACLQGWLDGDGCYAVEITAGKEHDTITGVTASPKLAETITRLALSCGIRPSTYSRQPRKDRAQAFDVCFNGDSAAAINTSCATKVRRCRVEHGFSLRVKRNDVSFVERKMVYCLQVDHAEHSFIANGYAVHNCVAEAGLRWLLFAAAQNILFRDALEQLVKSFSPFHYATGRVIIGKNLLKGGAGSVGGWQAEALAKFGWITQGTPGIEYSKGVADAWGDDKKFQGKSFRDFMESAEGQKVLQWARTESWNEVRDALYHGYPLHICSDTGYTMKPNASGLHLPSGTWPHAMTLFAYWENVKVPCVGIMNSWGDVHGTVKDPATGEPLPKGTILVPLEYFVPRHLRGSECIALSSIDGFDAQIDWSRLGGVKSHAA